MNDTRKNNPRVLVISGSYPDMRCGIGDYTERLVESLRGNGIETNLLTTDSPSIRKKDYIYPLVKRWSILSIPGIISFVRDKDPDIINLQVPTLMYKPILNSTSLLPMLLKIFLRNKLFIVTTHDFSISRPIFKIFFLPLFIFSDIIMVTNEEDAAAIVKFFPYLKNKVRKVYMGPTIGIASLPAERKESLCKKLNYEKKDRFIITSGFIKSNRFVDMIIKAFRRLSAEDSSLKLIVLGDTQRGRDAGYRDYICKLADNSGLEGKVYFTGFCDSADASFYLSLSDMSIQLYERGASFRRTTIINSIIRNVPVITNVTKESDGELLGCGAILTVDYISVDEVYKKARALLYNPELMNVMKRKAEAAGRLFNWENSVNELIRCV